MLSRLQPVLYIQLSPDHLSVRQVHKGTFLTEPAEMAVSGTKPSAVLAIGDGARSAAGSTPGATLVRPFSHPRSLVSDFNAGQQLLRAFIRKAIGKGLFAIAPSVILHPLGEPAGGYTQVEARALLEMALGAGAAKAVVWHGRTLLDDEIRAARFPADGQVLA